jgi:hypothetical protein
MTPPQHSMTTAAYMTYLASVACQRPVTSTIPIPEGIPPSTLLMDIFRYIGDGTHPITRHGVDALMDLLFENPAFQATLTNAADIQEHFTVTFLRHTSTVFQDHWTYVILPAWKHHADVWAVLCQ